MKYKSFVVLTWMCDNREFSVACDVMEYHKANIVIMTLITMMIM